MNSGAQTQAAVHRALNEEDLVDGVLKQPGVVLPEEGAYLLGRNPFGLGSGNLTFLELAVRDDVAVHLGDDALDHLRPGGRPGAEDTRGEKE